MRTAKKLSFIGIPLLLVAGVIGCSKGQTLFGSGSGGSSSGRFYGALTSMVSGCFIPGSCANPDANYEVKGTGNLPNFRTAFTFYKSAFSLSDSETSNLRKNEDRVWENIPTYGNPQIMTDTNGIALIQVAAGGCADFLAKGRGNTSLIGGMNLDATPANIASANWDSYRNILVSRLWGEDSVAGDEKTALDTLLSKAKSQNSSNSWKVAYLLCISVATAPKALIN